MNPHPDFATQLETLTTNIERGFQEAKQSNALLETLFPTLTHLQMLENAVSVELNTLSQILSQYSYSTPSSVFRSSINEVVGVLVETSKYRAFVAEQLGTAKQACVAASSAYTSLHKSKEDFRKTLSHEQSTLKSREKAIGKAEKAKKNAEEKTDKARRELEETQRHVLEHCNHQLMWNTTYLNTTVFQPIFTTAFTTLNREFALNQQITPVLTTALPNLRYACDEAALSTPREYNKIPLREEETVVMENQAATSEQRPLVAPVEVPPDFPATTSTRPASTAECEEGSPLESNILVE